MKDEELIASSIPFSSFSLHPSKMPTVHIPPQMRDLTAGRPELVVEGRTLRQVIAALDAQCPGLAERLVADDRILPGLAISIDGTVTSRGLLAPVEPTSQIHFLPAFGGG
jgi:molybdopterin synthase sulfur carrier subunit